MWRESNVAQYSVHCFRAEVIVALHARHLAMQDAAAENYSNFRSA